MRYLKNYQKLLCRIKTLFRRDDCFLESNTTTSPPILIMFKALPLNTRRRTMYSMLTKTWIKFFKKLFIIIRIV